MSDPLGLSIGTTNLVAARLGNPPISRRSVLGRPGQMLGGFVERVGDPVPLIAPDGSSYQADALLVEALDGMILAAGGEQSAQIAVAVPAHWNGATLRSLRTAMRARPRLSPNGTPARLVSDAVASLTALAANPGLPRRGVVALMDFGGGGTSVTLADASSGYEPIETVRLTEFAGDQLDQVLLAHVLDGISDADGVDPAGTAAVGSLTALRDECRRAKEELSEETAASVAVEMPRHHSAVRVTRSELESLMAEPITAVLTEFDELLLRNRIAPADVSAIATVGGGARIPLIHQRLSSHTQSPVLTTRQPALDAAVGATIFAAYGADADAQTGVAPAALITAAQEAAPGSATFRALAWSQDDDPAGDPLPYTGADYTIDTGTRAAAQYVPPIGDVEVAQPKAWQRLPQLVFGLAAVAALVAVGGVAIALTSVSEDSKPVPKTSTTSVAPPSPPPSSIVPPPTTVEPPPPPPPPVTVTTEAPPPPQTETKYVEVPTKTTTTTTTQPTTTTTTTTTETTTTTTTPSTTTETSTTPSMTTSYITVPFVPVPIPIQVPNSAPPSYQQPYQQPYQRYPY